MNHRDEKLDALIGKNVALTDFEGRKHEGILGYAEDFSSKHGYRKPGYYYVNEFCFRKSHIRKIEERK